MKNIIAFMCFFFLSGCYTRSLTQDEYISKALILLPGESLINQFPAMTYCFDEDKSELEKDINALYKRDLRENAKYITNNTDPDIAEMYWHQSVLRAMARLYETKKSKYPPNYLTEGQKQICDQLLKNLSELQYK